MKNEELRIGNWVFCPHLLKTTLHRGVVQIDTIPFLYDGIQPIFLSSQTLRKCGFINDYEMRWSKGEVSIIGNGPTYYDGFRLLNGEERTNWGMVYCCVHELQNLYYSLTGEELTYTP